MRMLMNRSLQSRSCSTHAKQLVIAFNRKPRIVRRPHRVPADSTAATTNYSTAVNEQRNESISNDKEFEDAASSAAGDVNASEHDTKTVWQQMKQMQEERVPVTVTATAANQGGLVVQYQHSAEQQLQGFIPRSHVPRWMDKDNMADCVGLELQAVFLELDEDTGRLVLSSRNAPVPDHVWQGLTVGRLVTGVVSSITQYGAFVDIEAGPVCINGLLHISQITRERLSSVEQVLKVGDQLRVVILNSDKERGRVTLSTKKLERNRGDMVLNRQAVFDGAEEMAAAFREERSQKNKGGR